MNPTNDPKKSGTPQPPTTAPFRNPPSKPKSNLLPIMVSVGFLLLVAVAWLTYNSMSATRALEQKVAELQEAENLRSELEKQYSGAIAELDNLKSDNEQINALIDQQKMEIQSQKNQISGLLRDKRQYDAARAEIRDLKARLAGFVADIEQLRAEQEFLSQENTMLKDVRDSLSSSLQAKLGENEQLAIAKAQLVTDKERLSKSVEIGSVVQVKGIRVTPQKVRKGGKTADQKAAKKTDQLKVCFTTIVNDLVKPGNEEFFIRIIGPNGETLADEALGSGEIFNNNTGEQVPYTQMAAYDYANDETQLCHIWKPETSFQKGKYFVEIYNKGYMSGYGDFELR